MIQKNFLRLFSGLSTKNSKNMYKKNYNPVLFISGNIEFLASIKKFKTEDAYVEHLSKPCQNKDYINGINKLFEKSKL